MRKSVPLPWYQNRAGEAAAGHQLLDLVSEWVRMASRSVDMQCWKCGAELKNLPLPFQDRRMQHASLTYTHALAPALDPRRWTPAAKQADFTLDKDSELLRLLHGAHKSLQTLTPPPPKKPGALAEMFEKTPGRRGGFGLTDQTEADRALAELKNYSGGRTSHAHHGLFNPCTDPFSQTAVPDHSKLIGWSTRGEPLPHQRCVLMRPHVGNWDFPDADGGTKLELGYSGWKHTLSFPFGGS